MLPKPYRQNLLIRMLDVMLHGPPGELLPFSSVQALGPHGEHYLGVRPIPVNQIVGSVNRHRDFDRHFRPKRAHLETRFGRIRDLWHDGHAFPAIQVYQVGEVFFVRDGNHRVSVARTEGQAFIDAEVIEVMVDRPHELRVHTSATRVNSTAFLRSPSPRALRIQRG